jgi:hypothetical protein
MNSAILTPFPEPHCGCVSAHGVKPEVRNSAAPRPISARGDDLGFASVRPEKEDNDGGPDNLWGLSPTTNAVLELTTEITRADQTISKTEASQLLSSIQWYTKRNTHVTNRIPVLLHPSREPDRRASLPANTRIITEDDLSALRTDIERFADELAANRSWAKPTAEAEALQRNTRVAAGSGCGRVSSRTAAMSIARRFRTPPGTLREALDSPSGHHGTGRVCRDPTR